RDLRSIRAMRHTKRSANSRSARRPNFPSTPSAAPPQAAHQGHSARVDRKARQLCHQVAETLDQVFAETPDDLIRDLRVVEVEPAPASSRLLATVAPLVPGILRIPAVLEHLTLESARLRAEVAASITRRRAPTLVYRVALD